MGCTVLPIWPKQAQLASPFGMVKFGLLRMLNISARTSSVFDSVSLNLRIKEKSQSAAAGVSEGVLTGRGKRSWIRPLDPRLSGRVQRNAGHDVRPVVAVNVVAWVPTPRRRIGRS